MAYDDGLNPDYLSEAERDDWENYIPLEDLEWAEWWTRRTYPTRLGAVVNYRKVPPLIDMADAA